MAANMAAPINCTFRSDRSRRKSFSFGETSYEKVQDYTEKWARLVCQQGDVARYAKATFVSDDVCFV